MKFTDLKNFKPNEMVKRHAVSIAVHGELYEALSNSVKNKKHASQKFQILMLKHFNAKTLAKALNDYDNNNIYAPESDYITVTGHFIQKDYDRFCDIVDANKFGTVNYCAKILFYWLMQNKVGGNNPVVKLPSITANKKDKKRTITNVNFNHSFTKSKAVTKDKTVRVTANKNGKIEINIKIDIK